jgi:hypothetical protein
MHLQPAEAGATLRNTVREDVAQLRCGRHELESEVERERRPTRSHLEKLPRGRRAIGPDGPALLERYRTVAFFYHHP